MSIEDVIADAMAKVESWKAVCAAKDAACEEHNAKVKALVVALRDAIPPEGSAPFEPSNH